MSKEKGEGSSSQKAATSQSQNPTERTTLQASPSETPSQQLPSTPRLGDEPVSSDQTPPEERKPAARQDQPSDSTSPTTPDDAAARPRQVIAVSASKGPAAFFNLARKFLVTDEMCDLSALEGAIVSAVDAAHLLERSKLATIVRVQTSYVTVEPKGRKQQQQAHSPQPQQQPGAAISPASAAAQAFPSSMGPPQRYKAGEATASVGGRQRTTRELRRARIVITVKRTESYKRWLEENPLQAIIAGDGGDEEEGTEAQQER